MTHKPLNLTRPLLLSLCLFLAACALPNAQGWSSREQASSKDSELRLADTALANGNPDVAIPLYKKRLQRNPADALALQGLASALYQTNEMQQARQIYLQLQSVAPQSLEAGLGLARISIRQQQLDDAAARYQEILKRLPDNLPALAGLGVVYDMQGQYTQAQATYRQALLLHPDDLSLRNDLGLSLVLSRQLRAGITELLKIVDVPSAPPQARQNLALAYGLLGNEPAAERVLQSDMPQVQIQSNLRYYRILRSRLALSAPPSKKKHGRR